MLLACQVALGSAGALFLCLCAPHEAPCAPPAPVAQADDCCAPSEQNTANEDDCADLLFTSEDIETDAFHKDGSKLSPTPILVTFELPELHRPAELFQRQPTPARAPPGVLSPESLYTQTIKLLL